MLASEIENVIKIRVYKLRASKFLPSLCLYGMQKLQPAGTRRQNQQMRHVEVVDRGWASRWKCDKDHMLPLQH